MFLEIPVGIAIYFAGLNIGTAIGRELNLYRSSKYEGSIINKIKNNNTSETESTGFMLRTKNAKIGFGIDDGYTKLLKLRQNNDIENCHTNNYQIRIMQLVELFFDNKVELQKLHSKNNLYGLISYLEKYAARDEVINFILDVDKIQDYSHILSPIPKLTYTKVQLKLYDWYSSYYKDDQKIQDFTNLQYRKAVTK